MKISFAASYLHTQIAAVEFHRIGYTKKIDKYRFLASMQFPNLACETRREYSAEVGRQ
jgi:hypothetical protein